MTNPTSSIVFINKRKSNLELHLNNSYFYTLYPGEVYTHKNAQQNETYSVKQNGSEIQSLIVDGQDQVMFIKSSNDSEHKSLVFDGATTVIETLLEEPLSGVTHELWFKTTEANGGLFMCDSENNSGHDRHIYLKDGNVFARVWSDEKLRSEGLRLNDGVWHHVAHTLGTRGHFLYIDGVKVAEGTKTSSDFNWQKKIVVGRSYDAGKWQYFKGNIAEVRLWSIERSQSEIQESMTGQLTGEEEGLLCYWPMDEVSGSTIADHSGNKNTGLGVGLISRQNLSYSMKFYNRSQYAVKAYRINNSVAIYAFELNPGEYYDLKNADADYIFKTTVADTNGPDRSCILDTYSISRFDKEFYITNTLAGFINHTHTILHLYQAYSDGREIYKKSLFPKDFALLENINGTQWLARLTTDVVFTVDAETARNTVEIRNADIEAYLSLNKSDRTSKPITVHNLTNLPLQITEVNLQGKDPAPRTIQDHGGSVSFSCSLGALVHVREQYSGDFIQSFTVNADIDTYYVSFPTPLSYPTRIQLVNETSLLVEILSASSSGDFVSVGTLGKSQSMTLETQLGQMWIVKDVVSGLVLKVAYGERQEKIHRVTRQELCSKFDVTSVSVVFTNNSGFPVDMYWIDYEGKMRLWGSLEVGASETQGTLSTHPWRFLKQDTGQEVGFFIAGDSASQMYSVAPRSPATTGTVSAKFVNHTRETISLFRIDPEGSWSHIGDVEPYRTQSFANIPKLSYIAARNKTNIDQPIYVVDLIQIPEHPGLVDGNGVYTHTINTNHLRSIDNGRALRDITFSNITSQVAKLYAVDLDGNWDFKDEIPANDQVIYSGDSVNALYFNGSDTYVSIALDEPETEISHELWFKTRAANGGLICATAGGLNSGHDRHLYLKDGNIFARVFSEETIGSTGLNLADGVWHQAVHVLGHNGQKIYVDGEVVASGTKSTSDFTWQTHLIIGYSHQANPGYFNGHIFKVRAWKKPLIASEINTLIYEGDLGADIGLAGEWYLDEGSGTVARDTAEIPVTVDGVITSPNWQRVSPFLEQEPIFSNYRYVAVSKGNTHVPIFNGQNTYFIANYKEQQSEITHEMWFKTAEANGGLFMCIGDESSGGDDRDI